MERKSFQLVFGGKLFFMDKRAINPNFPIKLPEGITVLAMDQYTPDFVVISSVKAHPDQDIPDDYDWLADEVFMTKYKKLFFDNITTICKKKNINISNIVFAIDCKHTSIWRNREQNSYKIISKITT